MKRCLRTMCLRYPQIYTRATRPSFESPSVVNAVLASNASWKICPRIAILDSIARVQLIVTRISFLDCRNQPRMDTSEMYHYLIDPEDADVHFIGIAGL